MAYIILVPDQPLMEVCGGWVHPARAMELARAVMLKYLADTAILVHEDEDGHWEAGYSLGPAEDTAIEPCILATMERAHYAARPAGQ